MNIFLSKVKFASIDAITEKQTTATNVFLINAVSFTEAEAKTYEAMQETEFTVQPIRKFNVSEIIFSENKEFFFEIKVCFSEMDEKGKINKNNETVLVQANEITEALNILNEKLNDSIADFEVNKIVKTSINSYID